MLRAACLAIVPLAFGPLVAPPTASHGPLERTALYLEDAPIPRPVAQVQAGIATCPGGPQLQLTVAAMGDGVDALPGIEGVPGANLRTAEELDRLLGQGALRLVTRNGTGECIGELIEVRRGRLPARALRTDGRLVFDAVTTGDLPVAVTFASAPLPDGESWSYLEADGVPRLAVQVQCTASGAEVLAIESLGERLPAAPGGGRR